MDTPARRFTLTAPPRLTPGEGEDFGMTLGFAADAFLERLRLRTGGGVPDMDRCNVAAIYELAADAYRSAGSASAGHNRRARYDDAAEQLRAKAARLLAGA